MLKLSIIGTSKIVEEHIKAAKAAGFELFSIASTRKKSKNLKKILKKFKFKFSFDNWIDAVNHSNKFKNTSFLIAPRIQDTFKVLDLILKKKNFVFVEKPLTTKINQFNKLIVNNNKVFLGYNRIFYKNIVFLKKNINNIKSVIVKCPELNKKNILYNSVHVISVLLYLFGDLKILSKKKSKKNIFIHLINKKNVPVYLFFNFNASENYSINIYGNKKRFFLKPLETLSIFDGMAIKKNALNKNLVEYMPKLKFKKNEMMFDNFKPGFLAQMKAFKKFIQTKRNIKNNLIFGKKIMLLAKKISA